MFEAFDKIPRFSRDVVITEKIDGTNAQIDIVAHDPVDDEAYKEVIAYNNGMTLRMYAGSRNRYITPESDNFGFAAWAKVNAEELFKLGPGRHYGEWWGSGIQRRYDLTEKRFSLFNVSRWTKPYEAFVAGHDVAAFPACCHVVPLLDIRTLDTAYINDVILADLIANGSKAAPGFMKPEGIIIYHTAAGQLFKKLIENDGEAKGQRTAA